MHRYLSAPLRRGVLAATLAAATLGLLSGAAVAQSAASEDWVIAPAEARALIADGAIVLDMRSKDLRAETPIEGAVVVAWQDFAQADKVNRGNLLDDDPALTAKFQQIGISRDVPVVALGVPLKGWGEDGRLVWTLRSSGHDKAFLVDGGAEAVLADGPLTIAPVKTPGDFVAHRVASLEATKEDVKAALGQAGTVIIDAREEREYKGETPYGEARAGHIPGAKHLYFRDMIGADGRLLQGEQMQALLSEHGIGPDTKVISYCTAGIRSAYVTAVLRSNGIDAKNYDGSMSEWAAQPEADYPMSLQ